MPEPIGTIVASNVASPRKLYRMLEHFATANDRAADNEYRKQLDDLTLELAGRYPKGYEGVDPEELPAAEDVKNASREFCKAHDAASGPKKRKLLTSAFYGYFNPKFFLEGMSKLLWDYAVQLEYPDATYLRRLLGKVDEQLRQGDEGSVYYDNGMEWPGRGQLLTSASLDSEFARRLGRIGLVDLEQHEHRADYVIAVPRRDLVRQLMEFLWDDDASAEAERNATVAGTE